VATPGLPLPLRDALAALAIAAFEDDAAVEALRWLATPGGVVQGRAATRLVSAHLIDPGGQTLLAVHAPHAARVATHAARALRAAAGARALPPPRGDDPVRRALRQAAALWDVGLFFEVHEVLETVWRTTSGAPREALQGVIQLAVAHHHLAHGNLRGARRLLREGLRRLAALPADVLPGIDLGALLLATRSWESALAAGTLPAGEPPPLALDRVTPGARGGPHPR
jgi:hypothetical protein